MEIWKDIKGFEDYYKISSVGSIKSIKKNAVIKPWETSGGYLQIVLSKNGIKKKFKIHRLVAAHFVRNKKNSDFVNHKDHNPKNNSFENLEWCTKAENSRFVRPRKNTSSKFKGVSLFKSLNIKNVKHWRAYINVSGKRHNIGYFKTEKEAALAYNELAKKLHGNFAYLNEVS